MATELLALARHQTQGAQLGRRHERGTQEPGTAQCRKPFRIRHIGLAAGDLLHMPCIDDDCPNANFFKIGVGALPIDAGALHHDEVGRMARTPVRQGASISFEGTKGPTLNLRRPVRSFDEGTGGDLGLMHIEPDHPFVQ